MKKFARSIRDKQNFFSKISLFKKDSTVGFLGDILFQGTKRRKYFKFRAGYAGVWDRQHAYTHTHTLIYSNHKNTARKLHFYKTQIHPLIFYSEQNKYNIVFSCLIKNSLNKVRVCLLPMEVSSPIQTFSHPDSCILVTVFSLSAPEKETEWACRDKFSHAVLLPRQKKQRIRFSLVLPASIGLVNRKFWNVKHRWLWICILFSCQWSSSLFGLSVLWSCCPHMCKPKLEFITSTDWTWQNDQHGWSVMT